ncbi:beta-N-acetylhexosaminidase [Thauera linaloolentis]|uniref:Beta-hexosaminidase n=1 Tax=Thauera linaloolentis (strain DSM 12138 / JCM 21573 / CCUG 41526 / CIP 105981 / IAM 15112 / NBRC 102519 / 47Lol) TaxID=1123367 RepID=N6Y2V2_THAL4|nr:beta-N-acetylhexosaminidase [Thauera linaloolentis]ENO88531.1 beta-hexosaminidase [Thauera linaloolentis 47Lol = DSM 12138]MCM8564892.1 beta-N-acetylhexosaminidase [Thauera linaloolentis]
MTLPVSRPRGPVMIDVAGTVLTEDERAHLLDTLVGGVILFARNFTGSEQLRALAADIRALRDPALLIAVDHEGGRVQRFRGDGFTRLPSMRSLGALWEQDHFAALDAAHAAGFVLAAELRAHGVDLSFAPVLDLDYGACRAIGNRAFHRDPQAVAALAQAVVAGMAQAGMGAIGKHFPGHGFVEADSHHDVPVDSRDFDTLWNEDIAPYRHRLGRQLAGVMPAHVIYPKADPGPAPQPAGFSPFWLKEVLRTRLGFQGVIFSDDLNMEGARVAGDIVGRARAAYAAGCDMLLVCNRPDLAAELLDRWAPVPDPENLARLASIVPTVACPAWLADPFALELHPAYVQARQAVAAIADDAGTAPAMTAATIGEQRTEMLRKDG